MTLGAPVATDDQTPTVPASCSVVVCAHTMRRWDHLRQAVASVAEQEPGQIVVVVDHNEELLWRASEEFSDAAVVENPRQQGISGARNAGIERADRPIVVFLDDDAIAQPGWLAAIARAYCAPDIVGVGGHVAGAWEGERPSWFPAEFDWVVGCSYRGLPTELSDVRNAIGANMSFRRSVFAEVGGFDERFGRVGLGPAGCDETEFSLRVRARLPGSRIVYEPSATVEHFVPADRATWRYFRARCKGEGRSKSMVVDAAGAVHGTASERRYATRTLPAGAIRGLREFVTSGELSGVKRSAAIVAGLATTSAAYLQGRALRRLSL